jgi:serine/threonine protein kinase
VVGRIYTPGFVAPETLRLPAFGPAPDPAVDRFALGAMLVHLLLGAPPAFLPDETDDNADGRTLSDRIRGLLALAEGEQPLIRQWWPLLTGLCESDPDRRWTLTQAADFLAERATGGRCEPSAVGGVRGAAADRGRPGPPGVEHAPRCRPALGGRRLRREH